MKRKIIWLILSYLMVLSLLVASCTPTVTEEEGEEAAAPPAAEQEVVTEEEAAAPPEEEVEPAEEATTPTADQITTSGHVTRDEIWSGTVLITGDVCVNKGVTLTVQPGTMVKFKHWRPGYTEPSCRMGLSIEGTLRAIGTPEKPIRFTSDAPSPEHSDWRAINFGSGASDNCILDYCIVEFAKGCGIGADHANFTLSNSIVRWCQEANVWLNYSSATITRNRIYGAGHGGIEFANSNPTITHNTFSSNGLGIVAISTSNPIIRHNIITGNRVVGILIKSLSPAIIEYNNVTENAHGGIQIFKSSDCEIRYNNIHNNAIQLFLSEGSAIATDNWWGTTNRKDVDRSIQIDPVQGGSVSYEPFLTSPADTEAIEYDYENNETYAHPPATEKDTFPYFVPSDETRRIVSSWSTAGNPTGIAWDGEYLWVVTLNNELLKYDTGGRLVDSLAAPGSLPIALVFDGQYLWSLDFSEQLAYQFDFSGKVVKSIPAPVGGYGEGGLAYDGEYLWTAPRNKLYKIDTSGNIVDVIQIQAGCCVNGMAWDGEHLWVSDKDMNDKIFEVDPSNGEVVHWINPPGDETWGMTWFDGYLWACEWTNDWDNYLVVKMEPTTSTQ